MHTIKTHIDATDNSRSWSPLSCGYNWIMVDGRMVQTDTARWDKHLNHIRRTRNHYMTQRYFKAAGKYYPVRVDREALNINLFTLTPWHADGLYRDLSTNAKSIGSILYSLAQLTVTRFGELTHREVLAVSLHLDTRIPHFDVWSTRINSSNELTAGSTKYAGLIGPWSVGIYRQMMVGVRQDDEKTNAVEHRIREENMRHNAQPVDLSISMEIDAYIGTHHKSINMQSALDQYKNTWEQNRIKQLKAEREALIRIKEKLI